MKPLKIKSANNQLEEYFVNNSHSRTRHVRLCTKFCLFAYLLLFVLIDLNQWQLLELRYRIKTKYWFTGSELRATFILWHSGNRNQNMLALNSRFRFTTQCFAIIYTSVNSLSDYCLKQGYMLLLLSHL